MSDKLHIVVDELVPKDLQDQIHMDSKKFLWLYNRSTYQDTNHIITSKVYDVGQLVLPIYYADGVHSYYDNIKPIIDAAQKFLKPIKSIYRAKFNLLWMTPESQGRWNYPHRDSNDIRNYKLDKWSIVYYVNNADGDTVLFYPGGEEVRVTPKRGQALIFPSHIKHASSNPQTSMERIVLNIVLETE